MRSCHALWPPLPRKGSSGFSSCSLLQCSVELRKVGQSKGTLVLELISLGCSSRPSISQQLEVLAARLGVGGISEVLQVSH